MHNLFRVTHHCLGTISLLLLCAAASAQVNLLPNGSFERRSSGGLPDRWANEYPGAVISVVSGIPTACGDKVFKLEDSSATKSGGIGSEAIPVVPGASYRAEAYIRSADTSPSAARIYVKFYDASSAETGSVSTGTTASNAWEYVGVTGIAPSNAASARVLCYSPASTVGTNYFDGVSFRLLVDAPERERLFYAAPAAMGSGSGDSRGNAAKYNSTTFWSAVRASVSTNPVTVKFLEGEYTIDKPADTMAVESVGNRTHLLTLEGEKPFGTVFTRTDAATTQTVSYVTVKWATNMVIRHLHWENDTTLPDRLVNYCMSIGSGSGAETENVAVEGCSFVGVNWNIYGAMGFHYSTTHGGRTSHCEFVRGGFSSGFHFIYNAYGSYDLLFENNYFQDCAGAYLRLRGGCHEALVRSNEFVSTSSSFNQPFLHMPTFNNINPGDETWGRNFRFLDNQFTYVSSGSGQNCAILWYHSGFDPLRSTGVLWDYLLTSTEATILKSGTVQDKKALIRKNFGVNFDTQVEIRGNTLTGYHPYTMRLQSASAYSWTNQSGVVTNCPNYGGDGTYNISDIHASARSAPSTNSWTLNASGRWDTAANWTGGAAPNNVGSAALLTNNITAARTNTIDTDVTLARLQIGSMDGAYPFSVDSYAGSTLVFANDDMGAELVSATGNASDTIYAPVMLADDLTITNSKTLTIRGNVGEFGRASNWGGGPRKVVKTGAGLLTFYSANTFSGGLFVKGGLMNAPGKAGFGTITIGDASGSSDAALIGSGTYTNAIVVKAGSTGVKTLRNSGTGANIIFSGPLLLEDDATVNAGSNTGYTQVSGQISGAGGLTSSSASGSANYVRLSGSNTFSGGVTLSTGPLRLSHDSALGSGTLTINGGTLASHDSSLRRLANPVVVNANCALGLLSGGTGSLIFTGPVDLGSISRNLTMNVNVSFLETISGTAGLTKTGTGVLTLAGQHTYTGGTYVSTGALIVDGGLKTSVVSVGGGTTFSGNAVLSGAVQVNSGGTLAPGISGIGSMTISNVLTFFSGSTNVMEISKTAGTNDSILGLAAVNYAGTLRVVNLAGTFVGGESFKLFSAGTYTGKFSETNLPALNAGLSWAWDPSTGTLSVDGGMANTPTNVLFAANGDSLSIWWPASHKGWLLQSNSIGIGRPDGWFDVPGSQNITNFTATSNGTVPAVFYRLRKP